MRKLLLYIIVVVSLNACDKITYDFSEDYKNHARYQEYLQSKQNPQATVILTPTPVVEETKTRVVNRANPSKNRANRAKCPIPFNEHTKCTKCPSPTNVDPNPDDVRRYLRFGTGKGHTLLTPSGHHKGQHILLLTDTFGMAESVAFCGHKGCKNLKLSNAYRPDEMGFANDCRQHWKYSVPGENLNKQIGSKKQRIKVMKNGKPYFIDLPNGKTFKDRIE